MKGLMRGGSDDGPNVSGCRTIWNERTVPVFDDSITPSKI